MQRYVENSAPMCELHSGLIDTVNFFNGNNASAVLLINLK